MNAGGFLLRFSTQRGECRAVARDAIGAMRSDRCSVAPLLALASPLPKPSATNAGGFLLRFSTQRGECRAVACDAIGAMRSLNYSKE